MKYQVPQFIEIEDKIFGPLTFKQFAYLAGGAGLCFTLYSFLPFFIAVLLIIPVAIFAIALAFYKVNSKPFVFILASALKYATGAKLYIWKKRDRRPEAVQEKVGEKEREQIRVPKLSESKLKELAWSLGIKENVFPESKDSSKMQN